MIFTGKGPQLHLSKERGGETPLQSISRQHQPPASFLLISSLSQADLLLVSQVKCYNAVLGHFIEEFQRAADKCSDEEGYIQMTLEELERVYVKVSPGETVHILHLNIPPTLVLYPSDPDGVHLDHDDPHDLYRLSQRHDGLCPAVQRLLIPEEVKSTLKQRVYLSLYKVLPVVTLFNKVLFIKFFLFIIYS